MFVFLDIADYFAVAKQTTAYNKISVIAAYTEHITLCYHVSLSTQQKLQVSNVA